MKKIVYGIGGYDETREDKNIIELVNTPDEEKE
jgi:hypothetical protein